MLYLVLLWGLRILVGGILLLGLFWFAKTIIVGGRVWPGDEDLPIHKQRMIAGRPYGGRRLLERRWIWLGVGVTLFLPLIVALTASCLSD